MDLDLVVRIAYFIVPVIVGLVGVYFKRQDSRLTRLEEQYLNVVTKEELRIVIQDKIDTLKEDIIDIKNKLEKLYDFLLKQ